MPSATGSNWEKHTREFADDEKEEKKIEPLSDEYVFAKASYKNSVVNLRTEISKY